MARSLWLYSTKSYLTSTTTATAATAASTSCLLFVRSQSNLSSPNPNDLPDESSSSDPLLRKLEDAIHRIIVRRSAPDWLPFLPGSSYWVPPSRSTSLGSLGIARLVENLANPLSPEESLSTTTLRGWPSSDFFIKGAPPLPIEFKVTEIKVEGGTPPSNVSKPEDEEG